MRELRAIDLFCGVGGTTLGLKDAGSNVIGAIDCMREAVKGYSQNHPKVRVWEGDIKKISGEASILQGFPKSYQLPLHNSKQSTATLIGNAFPPNFTKAHALELAKVLKQEV